MGKYCERGKAMIEKRSKKNQEGENSGKVPIEVGSPLGERQNSKEPKTNTLPTKPKEVWFAS